MDDYGNEKSPEEVKDADEQYGTVLYIADHHTKEVHAVPVMSKGAPNLKLMLEELVRFGMQVAGGDPVIYQRERSTKQLLRAVQHCRANLGLEAEIRVSTARVKWTSGEDCPECEKAGKLFEVLCGASSGDHTGQGTCVSMELQTCFMADQQVPRAGERKTSYEVWSGRKYQGKICLFGESVMYRHLTAFKGEP